MHLKNVRLGDFDAVFDYVQKLWTYNTYDRDTVYKIFLEILDDPASFAFFLADDEDKPHGFAHGVIFNTFWLSGRTLYLSSLIVNEGERGQGYGTKLMDYVRTIAEAEGCKGIVLDSGLPRAGAHAFYEHYGFEKSCYGFEYLLGD